MPMRIQQETQSHDGNPEKQGGKTLSKILERLEKNRDKHLAKAAKIQERIDRLTKKTPGYMQIGQDEEEQS